MIDYRKTYSQLDYDFSYIDSASYSLVPSSSLTYERQELKPINEDEIISKYSDIFIKVNDCFMLSNQMESFLFGCPWDSTMDPKLKISYSFEGEYCNQVLIKTQGWDGSEYLTVGLEDGVTQRLPSRPVTYDCQTVAAYGCIMADGVVEVLNIQTNKIIGLVFSDWDVTDSKQSFNEFYFVLEQNSIYCAGKKKYIKIQLK